jgi:hypothetical protein
MELTLPFQQQSDSMFIIKLPEEIIEHIASFLDEAGVHYLRETCKILHQCILPPVIRIGDMKHYGEELSKKNWSYLSELKMYKVFLNGRQGQENLRL